MDASTRSASSLAARAAPASWPSRPETSAAAASACLRAWRPPPRWPGRFFGFGRDGQLLGGVLAALLGPGQARGGLVGRGAQLEQALRPGATALRPVRAEHIAAAGHGLEGGILPNGLARLLQVIGDNYVLEQPGGGSS